MNVKCIKAILSEYNAATFRRVGKTYKNDHMSVGLSIFTSKGKYFLKGYKYFGQNTENGLELVKYLQKRKYPANKLMLSRKGKPYIDYGGYKYSLFGFINEKEKLELNVRQVAQMGKYLGKLHTFTRSMKLAKGRFGWDHFEYLINKHFPKRKRAPLNLQEVLAYIHKNIHVVKCAQNQPKAAAHVEFTPEHMRFNGNRLVNVIDWDETCRDYCFYDIGTALISCFTPTLDYYKINVFLEAYNNERRLTAWEKNHMFEALQFGCIKFCLWNLTEPVTDDLKLDYKWPEDIERVQMLMKVSKLDFQKKLFS